MAYNAAASFQSAISAMNPDSALEANRMRSNLSRVPSEGFDDLGSLFYLRDEVRSEFRSIYESIIDSTISAMY